MREKVALIEHNGTKILRELLQNFPDGKLNQKKISLDDPLWVQQLSLLNELNEVWSLWIELDNDYFNNSAFITNIIYAKKYLNIFINEFANLSYEQLESLWSNFGDFIIEYSNEFKNHLQIYKKYLNQEARHQLSLKILETSGILFYSTKLEDADKILKEYKIKGNITQRYWADGRKRKDSDPEYKNSYFLKGVSMTRSLDFALDSGGVVFVFSREGIEHHHKIHPYAWNFSFSKNPLHVKQEREDFVVLHKEKDKFRNIDDPIFQKKYNDILSWNPTESVGNSGYKEMIEEYQKKSQELSPNLLKKSQGEYHFDSPDFLGFMISGDILDIYGPEQIYLKNLLHHHKFLGVVENQKSNRYLKS